MPTSNHVSGTLTTEQQQQALAAIAELRAQLPFLIDLSPEDRRALPKMGNKGRAFVDQGLATATQNEGILPRSFDLDEYRRDVELVRLLEPIHLALRQLAELVEDTFLAVGSDAYSATLVVYQAAKMAGTGGALDEHLDGLSKRFARRVRPAEDAPPSAG